jgi:hypothetical protein
MISSTMIRILNTVGVAALCSLVCPTPSWAGQRDSLDNGFVKAQFEDGALVRLGSSDSKQEVEISGDAAELTIDGHRLSTRELELTDTRHDSTSIMFSYRSAVRSVQVTYELQPAWRFLSKRLRLVLPDGDKLHVQTVEVLSAELKGRISGEHAASRSSGAVFLRFGRSSSPAETGMFLALQNPFLQWDRKDGHVALSYSPDMEWRAGYGPFESDRVCLGVYRLSGLEFPAHNLGEWKYVRQPEKAFDSIPKLDRAETDALTGCVEAFLLLHPQKSLRVHVPWCENDYQVDVATAQGRSEWKRILDQCAAVGVEHALFTPANSAIAPLEDNADAWGWENCLWLGLGQKIRKGEWKTAADPIPRSIQEMLDYAKEKHVKLVAYAYPTLAWKQKPEWTAWCGGKTGGYVGVDTGVRSFQDWFVDQLVAFQKRTGISGYSFDHWWIAYEPTQEGFKPTSKYAQWYGCRRVLTELRRRIPDVVMDGRQQYQWFGPWTWLAGSYPHPTTNDEQPGSFQNFPDLHFSRVSADRQRWAASWYRLEQFVPLDILPGYMTHQTPRGDQTGQCVRDRAFQVRDWDYIGWRYSVLSSIGTAPFNNVVNLLPARDEGEFRSFRGEDQHWLKQWLDFTDQNRSILRNLRPIIGPPLLGRVDGTAAITADHGFVFLFNPNYRQLNAEFALDASIGLERGDRFVFRELYPCRGRYWGKPQVALWHYGDKVSLPIKGPEALVLEVVPAAKVRRPLLLGAIGSARLEGGRLMLSGVQGEAGRTAELTALLPTSEKPAAVMINDRPVEAFTWHADVVTLPVKFAGTRFDHCQQVGNPDRTFSGREFRAEFTIPKRIFTQLANRRKAWPVSYSPEELLATWRGSDRLLMYIHIAEPQDKWNIGLQIDGLHLEMKRAYGDVYPLGRERTFTGFYAEVSKLKPDVPHTVVVSLPDGLQPGQFQGLFFENVEAELAGPEASSSAARIERDQVTGGQQPKLTNFRLEPSMSGASPRSDEDSWLVHK